MKKDKALSTAVKMFTRAWLQRYDTLPVPAISKLFSHHDGGWHLISADTHEPVGIVVGRHTFLVEEIEESPSAI